MRQSDVCRKLRGGGGLGFSHSNAVQRLEVICTEYPQAPSRYASVAKESSHQH